MPAHGTLLAFFKRSLKRSVIGKSRIYDKPVTGVIYFAANQIPRHSDRAGNWSVKEVSHFSNALLLGFTVGLG